MSETHLHSACPKCHLPVHEGEAFVVHEGRRYHARCAPVPEVAGMKDDPNPPVIGI